ncbi:MAG TPA: acetyl-CoA carboxylase biotin carboxyl carrier protein [Bacteroidia bacterium]|nr:acetyl-CoA carboxylase biotin carboxyl carrier protein [Bacteroidia bacterium]
MKLNEIQDLIKFVAKSGVSEVELETKDVKITIKTGGKGGKNEAPVVVQASVPVQQGPVVQPVFQPVVTQPAAETKAPETKKENVADESRLITIKSPMIGTFYRAPGPDKPIFINVGDEIKPGKVLCIIEAMKLFNEIESEVSGKIVKVLVDDASPVEYDQPLFLVEPA